MSLALGVAGAAAETGESAPIRAVSEGGFGFPEITGPEAPEEYPRQFEPVGPERRMRQAGDQEIVVEYVDSGQIAYSLRVEPAHAADGATVPTTIALTEDGAGPVVTQTVHFRAGNPAAAAAPFVFPVLEGTGWEGGSRTVAVELNEPKATPTGTPPAPSPPTCTVPSLHGLYLRTAKAKLRADGCAIGKVRLAAGATTGRSKVVKQFKPAGTRLTAGTPVAVKLAAQ